MPELPEVETVRKGLEPVLKNHVIADVELRRKNLRTPFPENFGKTLVGARVTGTRRRAKYILIDLSTPLTSPLKGGKEGGVLLVHLGMSGSFRTYAKGKDFTPETHDHVIFTLDNGMRVVFNDPRRFGVMDVFAANDEPEHKLLKHLGLEPLSNQFSGPALAGLLARKNTAVKVAIMDQQLVVGVGNIYASESLFLAGIDPRKKARLVTGERAERLASAIKEVLQAALESGGSTLRNYRQLDGDTGYFQHRFLVYGHAGQTCPCRIGKQHPVKSIVQGGRTTFFCPVKQR